MGFVWDVDEIKKEIGWNIFKDIDLKKIKLFIVWILLNLDYLINCLETNWVCIYVCSYSIFCV